MKEIIEVLKEVNSDINYEKEKKLVTNGLLTSFDLVMLIPLLNDKFGVNITVVDLIPENFESIEAIKNLIDKLK